MGFRPPELSPDWEWYRLADQARYSRYAKRYGPFAQWFAKRRVSRLRVMRRKLLSGGVPHDPDFSSHLAYDQWKRKRCDARLARLREVTRKIPRSEGTRRITRLLRALLAFQDRFIILAAIEYADDRHSIRRDRISDDDASAERDCPQSGPKIIAWRAAIGEVI